MWREWQGLVGAEFALLWSRASLLVALRGVGGVPAALLHTPHRDEKPGVPCCDGPEAKGR